MTTLSETQDNQICYEHTFVNYNHAAGSNEYSFTYPGHWIQYPSPQHLVALRSVTIEPAPREITFNNILLKRKGLPDFSVDLSMSVPLAYGDDMNVLNNMLKEKIRDKYEEYKNEINEARNSHPDTAANEPSYLGCNDYIFQYNQHTNSFVMKIISAYVQNQFYFEFKEDETMENVTYTSPDFKAIVGIKDDGVFNAIKRHQHGRITKEQLLQYLQAYPTVSLKWINDTISDIVFSDVWNRSKLLVSSSLSSLSENSFFTLTNQQHNPPKIYAVDGYKDRFTIHLYRASGRGEVELPRDEKDTIVIEMLLIAK